MGEEEDLGKITEMLLAGGKMLGVHCGKCRSPLFQFQGKIVCPVCGSGAKPTKPEAKAQPLKKVEDVLLVRVNSLADELAKETDQARTIELIEKIKSTLEVLERLKEG